FALRDPVHDALIGGVQAVGAPEVPAADVALGRHLAHHADVLIVAEHLLYLEAGCARRLTDLIDDRVATGDDAAQPGRHAGHPERCVVGDQLAVSIEVLVPGGLLQLLDQLQVLLCSHRPSFPSQPMSTPAAWVSSDT